MSNLTDFFPSGGGGGLTPKFQEFNASGTFTPSQALIDAGGYIEVFLVGAGGSSAANYYAATGGETIISRMYLTSVAGCSVTIGASTLQSGGGVSTFLGASAGGLTINSAGGSQYAGWDNKMGAGFVSKSDSSGSGGSGVLGYGAGSGWNSSTGGVGAGKANSGQGGKWNQYGGSGYCLIKWYE